MKKILNILLITLGLSTLASAQQSKVLDRVVAQVNNHIILKSDIDSLVAEVLTRERGMRFDESVWYEILESQIDKYVLIEQAAIDSVEISEEQLELRLDDYIRNLTAQFGSEQALEEASSSVDSVTCKKTFSDSEIHDSILNAYPLDNIK
jgi:peptidyl-prolyl cis-trans isomerase SurA